MISVTKSFLPNKEKYQSYLDDIFKSNWLTNNGKYVRELEEKLSEYLKSKHVILVNNGSLALHVAYKALELDGEVITTPFSFVATTSTLVWEGLKPIFCDISKETFNIESDCIIEKITENTSAIVPVHVFGNPCDVDSIDEISRKFNLKVIYDAAHAFNSRFLGESVLNWGDISTVSFHATKIFHTIEGGAIITNNDELAEKIRRLINFGITSPTSIVGIGTNAKMNEFQAAMGLCILDEFPEIENRRKNIWSRYLSELDGKVEFQQWNKNSTNNFSYAPILFDSESRLLDVQSYLHKNNIMPRRYFYPSLDTLDYTPPNNTCPISRDISSRILCLPMYSDLSSSDLDFVISKIKDVL